MSSDVEIKNHQGPAANSAREDRDGPAEPFNASSRSDRGAASADDGFRVFDRRFWADEESGQSATEDARRAEVPTYVEQLRQQVEQKDKQLRDYIAAYKAEVVEGLAQAKERLERESELRAKAMRSEVVKPMMTVLEALERSIQAGRMGSDVGTLLEGVKMVHLLMVQQMKELGLERIGTVGQVFDPRLHEAVAVTPVTDAGQDNVITAELTPGFVMGDQLIRAAQVQVGKRQPMA